ncbi:hypothetical protein [Streptomyces sp. NBC_00268]|uniref:hypothetical protein n=1 Tax=Streptomyces sp. NBC_00268 TaxID=2975695 RepID=UPI002253FEF1|nr:hypothetical protein [Streptomyces sp. NBC_00268]MCX5186217.1 hypothetical protein [Streptomyces sp. NBC_00268]
MTGAGLLLKRARAFGIRHAEEVRDRRHQATVGTPGVLRQENAPPTDTTRSASPVPEARGKGSAVTYGRRGVRSS